MYFATPGTLATGIVFVLNIKCYSVRRLYVDVVEQLRTCQNFFYRNFYDGKLSIDWLPVSS